MTPARFLHHAQLIAITGKSYRVKEEPVVSQAGVRPVSRPVSVLTIDTNSQKVSIVRTDTCTIYLAA
jgi:hypothetical protein